MSVGKGGKRPQPLSRLLSPGLRALPGYVTERTLGSPGFQQRVASALNALPLHLHDLLHSEGRRIVTGDFLININPSLKGLTPRGHTATWASIPGYYDGRTGIRQVALAEFIHDPVTNQVVPVPDVENGCREEVAHAVDDVLGESNYGGPVSHHDAQYIQAYQADEAGITNPAERALFAYQLLPGTAGREETFAALFAIIHGGYVDPGTDQLLLQRFSNTLSIVQQHLAGSSTP